MVSNKWVSWALSILLACSLVPANALAEALEETQATQEPLSLSEDADAQDVDATTNARIELSVASTGEDDAWVSFDTLEAAEKSETKLEAPLGMRLAGAEGTLEYRECEWGGSWPETWHVVKADGDGNERTVLSFDADVQLRLAGEVFATHSVWYRAYVEDAGWLEWAHDGESLLCGHEGPVGSMQVVLLTKEQSALEEQRRAERCASTESGVDNDGEHDGQSNTDAETKDADAEGLQDVAQSVDEQGVTGEQSDEDEWVEVQEDQGQTLPSDEEQVVAQDDSQDDAASKTSGLSANASATAAAKDEEGISVVSTETAIVAPTVSYKVHAESRGWMGWKKNGVVAGTAGKGKRLEAIRISLAKGADGGVSYRVRAQSHGWMSWKQDGAVAGTTGEGKRLEALRIKLTGNVSKTCDVWYRAHVQDSGWSKWVKNGALAGSSSKGKRMEAVQVIVVPKGGGAPQQAGEVAGKDTTVLASVSYRTYSSIFAWGGWMSDGNTAGAVGVSNMVEGFCAQLSGLDGTDLHYKAYVQGKGWQDEVTGGTQAGLPARGKRLEAIRMRLSGKAKKNFDIYYRVYLQGFGWLGWAKNNAAAGGIGLAKNVEAIEVRLVAKGQGAPKNDGRSTSLLKKPVIAYVGHVESYGWMSWKKSGGTCGTIGEGKRLEGLKAKVSSSGMSGQVQINAQVESYGWRGYVAQGKVAGAVGKGKRLEALRVRLTGELKQNYDVWYRVRVQGIGWMGWAKNGGKSGTQSLSLRVEAVQIKLLSKGSAAPGSTKRAFLDGKKVTKLGYQNPAGYYQVSTKNVKITKAARAPWNYVTPSRIGLWATRKDCVNVFIQRAREYVGSPYVWNYSCAPGVGVDCIGLVYQCAYACGMDLGGGTGYNDFNPWAHYITGNSGWHSHDANNFWNYGKALHVPLSSRRAGDVIWWPGHVAIYIGNDQIIEAYTPATGVIYSGLYDHGSPSGCIRLFQ